MRFRSAAAFIYEVEVKMQVAGSARIMVASYKTKCHNAEEFFMVYALSYRTLMI
jgi:hypothetical protein